MQQRQDRPRQQSGSAFGPPRWILNWKLGCADSELWTMAATCGAAWRLGISGTLPRGRGSWRHSGTGGRVSELRVSRALQSSRWVQLLCKTNSLLVVVEQDNCN